MFCIGLNKFRCPSPQRNRTKFPGQSDRKAPLSPDDPHSSKTADSRRRERAGIHSSPADHASPKPDRAFRPFRPRHRCPDRPCTDEAGRPPSPVRSDLSPMHRASAFDPHGFAGPAARRREKTGSLPPNDRIVPSTGMRPSTCTSSFRPPLRTGRDFRKASHHNTESFPYEPNGKSIRGPENRCAPHANETPKNRKGNGPAIRLPSNDILRCGFLSCATTLRNTYLPDNFRTSRNEKPPKEDKTGTGTRPLPSLERDPDFPKQCSEKPKHAATKSKKDSRTKLRIPTYRTSLSQTDIRILSQPFFSRKKGISYTSALLSAMLRPHTERKGKAGSPPRRCPPLSATRFHPRSPAFACSPALPPEKRNDARSEVGNDAPHGRKTSVTLLPDPHSPSTFFPHSVPGFPVFTAALARMPTRQVHTPMDRGLCLPSSSPTAGSPGSKPCKHPDRRPTPPRRDIGTAIPESAARRVFRRHVRTCRRNRPRPGPKPSSGNGPPRKMRK